MDNTLNIVIEGFVAPLVGAWIEMGGIKKKSTSNAVAPLVGAWIEIPLLVHWINRHRSLPLWERGLKLMHDTVVIFPATVAPLVGAWIEISSRARLFMCQLSVAPLVGAWIGIRKTGFYLKEHSGEYNFTFEETRIHIEKQPEKIETKEFYS